MVSVLFSLVFAQGLMVFDEERLVAQLPPFIDSCTTCMISKANKYRNHRRTRSRIQQYSTVCSSVGSEPLHPLGPCRRLLSQTVPPAKEESRFGGGGQTNNQSKPGELSSKSSKLLLKKTVEVFCCPPPPPPPPINSAYVFSAGGIFLSE